MKHILLTLLIFSTTLKCFCQDDCSKALEFKDKIKINRSGNTLRDVQNWFVSQNGQEVTSSDGWDANIGFVYNGVPIKLGGGSNSADYQKLVNAINTGNKELYSNNFVDYVYKEILKPEAYKVWLECIKEKQKTLQQGAEEQTKIILGEQQTKIVLGEQQTQIELAKITSEKKGLIGIITDETDESFILQIKWQPVAGVNSVKLKKPVVLGAECVDNTLFDSEIGSEFVSFPFYRDKEKQVKVVINTTDNRGSLSFTLSKAKQQLSLNTTAFKLPADKYLVNDIPVNGQFTIDPINISIEIDEVRKMILSSVVTGTVHFNILSLSSTGIKNGIDDSHQLNLERYVDYFDESGYRRRLLSSENVVGIEFSKKFWGRNIQKSTINNDYVYTTALGQSKRVSPSFHEETKWSGEHNYKIYLTNIIIDGSSIKGVLVIETGFPYASTGVEGKPGYKPWRDTGKTTFSVKIASSF